MPVSGQSTLSCSIGARSKTCSGMGESIGAIASKINVSWAAVAREIERHRTRETTHYQTF